MSIESIVNYFKSIPIGVLRFTFVAMEESEKVIAEEVNKLELSGDRVMADYIGTEAFQYMVPREELFRGKIWELYRAHCRELIQRIIKMSCTETPSMEEATDAECLSALINASMKALLSRNDYSLIGRLFFSVFGKNKFEDIFEGEMDLITQENPAMEDLLFEVRRKLACKCRYDQLLQGNETDENSINSNKGKKGGG